MAIDEPIQSRASTAKVHIEELLEARTHGRSPYDETTAWVGRVADDLYDKLAKHDLVPKCTKVEQQTLGEFIDGYIKGRSDVKCGKAVIYKHTRRCSWPNLAAHKPLAEITEGDADDWRRWLSRQ